MKFILYVFLGILFIIFLTRIFFGEPKNSLTYIVYQNTESNFIVRIFRIIPPSKSKLISEEIMQENLNFKLIKVIDKRYHVPYNYYFLRNNNIVKMVNNPYPKNHSIITLENQYTYHVDINNFNEYIHVFYPNTNKSDLIDKYCFFLSSTTDTTYYRKINDTTDISFIKRNHYKINELLPKEKYIYNIEKLLNELKTDNESLYWFYDKGVLMLTYEILNNRIESIDVKFLGYLGNETIHI